MVAQAMGFNLLILVALGGLALLFLGLLVLVKVFSSDRSSTEQTFTDVPRFERDDAGETNDWKAPGRDRLHKDKSDAMLVGVCSGIALKYDWDPSMVRLGFALGFFFAGGVTLPAYVILALVLPALRPPLVA